MYLRKLTQKDAPLMLEWMRDNDVINHLATDFSKLNLSDCERFIIDSAVSDTDIHFAIASINDEYMGTVSLKHINYEMGFAEFAIVVRKVAMGQGYSVFGMKEIFKYAYEKLGLKEVYWCVSVSNGRACRFYEKHSFICPQDIPSEIGERYISKNNLKWYYFQLGENAIESFSKKIGYFGWRFLKVNTVHSENHGQLSFLESQRDIPFDIKRIYYISHVPKDITRGFHAHKQLKQVLFCPFGKIKIFIDNGEYRREIILDEPSKAIVISEPLWREMLWIEDNSVLVVLASDYYDENDYIRDYQFFLAYQHHTIN